MRVQQVCDLIIVATQTTVIITCIECPTTEHVFALSAGLDVNRKYEQGQETLLGAAVRKGSVALVDLLLEHGAHVDTATPCKNDTLNCAVILKQYVCCMYLLYTVEWRKCNVVTCSELFDNNVGYVDFLFLAKTPLQMACFEGDLRVTKCLIQHEADIEVVDDTNRTALQWALRGGSSDVFKFLIQKNASKNRVASDGRLQECLFVPLLRS